MQEKKHFRFQNILEIRKLFTTRHGLWFQLNALARIPHLALSAALSPLSTAPLPCGPDEIHLWVFSEAVASLISTKQTFTPSGNTAQPVRFFGWEFFKAAIMGTYFTGIFCFKEVLYRTHIIAENLEHTHTHTDIKETLTIILLPRK